MSERYKVEKQLDYNKLNEFVFYYTVVELKPFSSRNLSIDELEENLSYTYNVVDSLLPKLAVAFEKVSVQNPVYLDTLLNIVENPNSI